MQTPNISVIMPVYNSGDYLAQAIESILRQSLTDFEFIIIDDCSVDNSVDIIKKYNDYRIVLLVNERNLGVTKSLNKGITVARGKYIARMDADDVAREDRLETQINFLKSHPSIGICGSDVELVDQEDNCLGYSRKPTDHICLKYRALYTYILAHPSVMGRAEIFKKNPYNEEFVSSQDTELWSRLLFEEDVKLANINCPLLKLRIHSTSKSQTKPPDQKRKSALIGLNNSSRYKPMNEKKKEKLLDFKINNNFRNYLTFFSYSFLLTISFLRKEKTGIAKGGKILRMFASTQKGALKGVARQVIKNTK